MSNVLVIMGDIFEGSAHLTVLPCSEKGTVSSATRRWLTMFGLPSPKDISSQLHRGEISDLIPFSGSQSITKYVVFAASVFNDLSSADSIREIATKLGNLTQSNSDIRLIETPLLGTGAGGLKTEVAGKALYQGFKSSAHPDATLYIFVFDRERQTTLQTLFSDLEGNMAIEPPSKAPSSILFLAADPTNASRLRLGEEFREIQEKLKLAKWRDRFRLESPQLSVRPADISQALLDEKPQIVHFSGHGMATGALCFENQIGEIHPIQPDALAALFEQFAHQVKCVVLNACYSEIQANAIAEHVDYVVGMNQAIGDKAAIAFAIGFYQALGAGRTIEEAYKLGCVQIRLQGIPEHLTPVLVKKGQVKSLPQETSNPQSFKESRQPSNGVIISLVFNKDGLVIKDEQELKASLAEVLFAAENRLQVTFDVLLEPLEVVKGFINSMESGEASPENRITKVNLLKQARTLEANQKAITAALPLLLLPPIRNAFASVDELIESLEGLAHLSFDSDYSANSFGLDVVRTKDPKINTLIWIGETEVEQIKTSTGLKNIFALIGSGWDLFDLPRETRFRKAIPAIVLEVIRRNQDTDKPFDLLEVLDLHSWSMGLH